MRRQQPFDLQESLEGTWYDRTLGYNAFLRGKKLEKEESASQCSPGNRRWPPP
jgi:hypothetical protein